jgi:short subunit fatty acids transporter
METATSYALQTLIRGGEAMVNVIRALQILPLLIIKATHMEQIVGFILINGDIIRLRIVRVERGRRHGNMDSSRCA